MARAARKPSTKSSDTLDREAGAEQLLRSQLASADKLNGELLERVIRLEDDNKRKEQLLRTAYAFQRKYKTQLETAGLIERSASPVDDALAARRAAMAAAKAEAMAGAPGTSVAVK